MNNKDEFKVFSQEQFMQMKVVRKESTAQIIADTITDPTTLLDYDIMLPGFVSDAWKDDDLIRKEAYDYYLTLKEFIDNDKKAE